VKHKPAKHKIAAAILAAMLAPAAASAMDVATFLAKADALERMGMRAAFSSDGPLIMEELNGANRALRAERLAAQSAGRRPAYCPDPNHRADVREIVAALRTIPVARRARTEVRDAVRAFYARRYPCPR
jgi:hypothetical protein